MSLGFECFSVFRLQLKEAQMWRVPTLILKRSLPLSQLHFLRESLQGMRLYALYRVHLDCKYIVGPLNVRLLAALPIDGVKHVLGNDIAGN